jgi:hypothetical protein
VAYQQLLTQRPDDSTSRDRGFGESILSNLPIDYKVYAFYYPSAAGVDDTLENNLRDLGRRTGKNLFINFGALNDPQYNKIVELFDITSFPVIVITAIGSLASPHGEYLSAYVRLDSKDLLGSPNIAIQCVEQVFNLFLQGKVAEAVALGKSSARKALLSYLENWMVDALKSVGGFLAGLKIKISIFDGTLEIQHS